MLDVNRVYVVHYSPWTKRKERLVEHLPFDVQWVESEPSEDGIIISYTKDEKTWNDKVIPYSPFRQLTTGDISVMHKHIAIYYDIVVNRYEESLIFEDDVILVDNFIDLYNANMYNTPIDWDLIFIGSGCNLRIPTTQLIGGRAAYKVDHPASKCGDSYCITLDAATRILSTIIPFTFPIDFELNYQMKLHNMNVYWWEPPLVTQGSETGLYETHRLTND